ncbi:LisH domain-containing protein armc9 [Geranomyces variabilis]|nr:LisH domain-containing protein armc9 [Geranomyces variabilis]
MDTQIPEAEQAEATLTTVLKQARTALLTSVSPLLATRDNQVEEQRERIAQLQDAHARAEKREAALLARHRDLQGDYHNLITIASELVQTLTACINGEKITPAYLSGICQRLASFKQSSSRKSSIVQSSDPATAAQQQPPRAPRRTDSSAHIARAADPPPPRQLPPLAHPTTITTAVSTVIPPVAAPTPAAPPPILDLTKISTDLQRSTDTKCSQLLQALRLLATRASTPTHTRRVLQSYIAADLFLLRTTSPLLPFLLLSPHPETSLQTTMLLNAMTSISAGRGYVLLSRDVIPTLLNHTFATNSTTITPAHHHHSLLTLQKLSLRRSAQSQMNDLQTLTRLFAMLDDTRGDLDALAPATVEYASALVMNLCLRTKGRKECMNGNEDRVLRVLSAVMEVESLQVKTYINGTLYSLFAEPSLRDAARAQGMEDMLSYMRESEDEQLVGQIDFVLKQLATEEDTTNNGNDKKEKKEAGDPEGGDDGQDEEREGEGEGEAELGKAQESDSAESEDGEEDDDDNEEDLAAESGSDVDDIDEREHDGEEIDLDNAGTASSSVVVIDPALVLAPYYVAAPTATAMPTKTNGSRKPSVSVGLGVLPTRPTTPLASSSSLRSSFVKRKSGGGGVILPSKDE